MKEIRPGSNGAGIRDMEIVGNQLFFTANDGSSGYELWKTDGTTNGTVLVKDIRKGELSSSPMSLENLNGKVLFAAGNVFGMELWISDGTTDGTVLLRDIRPGISSSNVMNIKRVGNIAFFTANDGTSGEELGRRMERTPGHRS